MLGHVVCKIVTKGKIIKIKIIVAYDVNIIYNYNLLWNII